MLSHHLNCKVNFESILPCISREKKYHGDFLEEHCFVYSRSGSLDTKPSASSWTTDRSYSPVVFVLWPHAWALGNGRWSEELIGTTFQTSLKEMSLLNVPCYFQEKKKKLPMILNEFVLNLQIKFGKVISLTVWIFQFAFRSYLIFHHTIFNI